MTEIQKHIRCKPGDVARYVLLPGDPARARRIADAFDEPQLVAENREYVIYNGKTAGVDVTVCSTGIGGPSSAIALEELIKVGADTFIRVGSSGGRQPDIPIGTLVVVTAAYRGDGTSREYMPLGFPAVADLTVSNALLQAAQEYDYPAPIWDWHDPRCLLCAGYGVERATTGGGGRRGGDGGSDAVCCRVGARGAGGLRGGDGF